MLRRRSHTGQDLLSAHADHFRFGVRCNFRALIGAGADERSRQEKYQIPTGPDERGGAAVRSSDDQISVEAEFQIGS